MYSPLRHLPSAFSKRRPIHLTFFVTRKCNAHCAYCFYLKSGRDGPGEAEELGLDEIRRLSGSMGRLLWLAFSGGEIFLRRDLAEISRIFYERNRPAIMLYPTNGLLPERILEQTERILRRCAKSTIVVKVSIDGLNGDHDRMRGTPGGFDKAMQTYRLLAGLSRRYANLELGINTVFCAGNQDRMDAIIDFVAALEGPGTHTISMVRGELEEAHHKDVDIAKYAGAISRLAGNLQTGTSATHRFRGGRLKAAQDIVQRRMIHDVLRQQRRLTPCYAGALSLVLTESGDVHPCEILDRPLGNVRDFDLDLGRLLRSEHARSVVDSVANGKCFCTHECNHLMNILFNPAHYPAVVREYLRLRPLRSSGQAAPGVSPGTAPCPATGRTDFARPAAPPGNRSPF